MGRRDEPELEELSKLLRRLETMEVAPKQESTHKPEPEAAQPQAEYVGALRGAAPAKVSDDRQGSPYGNGSYRGLDVPARADKSRPLLRHDGDRHRCNDRSRGVLGRSCWTGALVQRQRRPEERRRAPPDLLCAGRAERGEPETRGQRRRPGGSAPARKQRRRQTPRRYCIAPISTCAAASPARHGSCWSRRRS